MIDQSTTLSIALQLTVAEWKTMGIALREYLRTAAQHEPQAAARAKSALEQVADKVFLATSISAPLDP